MGTDNTCIYRDLLPIRELGQHPAIYLVTPYHVQRGTSYPEYIRLSSICTTLSHRINRARRNDICPNSLSKSFYYFRGIIIRSLLENIEVKHNRNNDLLVSGIIALLLANVSESLQLTSTTTCTESYINTGSSRCLRELAIPSKRCS